MSVGMLRFLRGLAVAWCAVSTLFAGVAQAEVDALRGARIAAGELVPAGDGLVAGPKGATVSFEHGSELRVESGSRVRFARQQKLHLGSGPDPMIPTRVLMLESGTVTARVPPAKRFALLMMGPRKLQAILSSGEATMIATEERATVAARNGNALVTVAEKWRRLPAGSMQIANDAHPEGWRREILGEPGAPVLSRRLLIEGQGAESSTIVAWPALADAMAYDVQLRSEGDVVARQERTTQPRVILGSLPAGNYQVSVMGVDDSGLHGAASPGVALNVVGLQIPPTAHRTSEGTIRLQAGQRVTLIGAEGLEVGYLGFDDFLPVPKTLGLVARRPIALMLRHAASGETLRLNLEPMSVKARIDFPRQPDGWPSHGLPVSVRLVDEKGYPVPDNFAVSFRVTVNVALAVPTWEREGSTLRTSVERPKGAGPWMVRVDVLDESGASLGMDFLEVGYNLAPARQAARR